MVDPTRFIESCKFDLCSDANSHFQNIFLCSAIAAYARECRLANVTLSWLTESAILKVCQDAQYGQCTGGAIYSDCAPKCVSTCSQMMNSNQTCYERECTAGCSCPSNSYLDTSTRDKPQCVPKGQCTCYAFESNTYLRAGTVVSKSCGNWYVDRPFLV